MAINDPIYYKFGLFFGRVSIVVVELYFFYIKSSVVVALSKLVSQSSLLFLLHHLLLLSVYTLIISVGSGAFVGGWVMTVYGSRTLYLGSGTMVAILLIRRIVVGLCSCCCNSKKKSDKLVEPLINETR